MHKAELLRTSLPPGCPDVAQRAVFVVAVGLGVRSTAGWTDLWSTNQGSHAPAPPADTYVHVRFTHLHMLQPMYRARNLRALVSHSCCQRATFTSKRSLVVRPAMCRAMYSASRPTPPTNDDASELRKNSPISRPGSVVTPRSWTG